MKFLAKLSIAVLSLTLALSGVAFAAHHWEVKMSDPKSTLNEKTFNIEFTTLSVEQNDDITVELIQDEVIIDSQVTTADYGDSGSFSVTVPTDGSYDYTLRATSSFDGDIKVTPTQTVVVDSVDPPAPAHGGVVRDGNTYTLTFSAPAGSDVTAARIYSSTNQTFTADNSTLVGTVPISPGQTKTFSYTAPDDAQRYHAVQLFDTAGNFSGLVADPEVTVTQGEVTPTDPEVAGEETGEDGAVGEDGAQDENEDDATDEKAADDKKRNQILTGVLIAAAALAALYYWFFYRKGKTLLTKKDKE